MNTPAVPLPSWTPRARTLIHRLFADQAEPCECTPPSLDAPWPWIGEKMMPRLSLNQTIFVSNTVEEDETLRDLDQLTMSIIRAPMMPLMIHIRQEYSAGHQFIPGLQRF